MGIDYSDPNGVIQLMEYEKSSRLKKHKFTKWHIIPVWNILFHKLVICTQMIILLLFFKLTYVISCPGNMFKF